jgi:magnesium transporter
MKHPDDTARLLEHYTPVEAAAFLDSIPSATAAAVLDHMSHLHGAACLESMGPERAREAAVAVAPSVLAALLRPFPTEKRGNLLDSVPFELRQLVERLLTFPEGTVGAATDPDVTTMPGDLSVTEAKRRLRRHTDKFHHEIYVVSDNRQLVGVLHVRELMRADSKTVIAGMMQRATVTLRASTRLASTYFHPAWNRMDAIPVVDDSGVLVGVLRHRQIRRLQSSPGAGGLVGALLGLGELYWVGLTTFLPVATGTESPESATSRFQAGVDHG